MLNSSVIFMPCDSHSTFSLRIYIDGCVLSRQNRSLTEPSQPQPAGDPSQPQAEADAMQSQPSAGCNQTNSMFLQQVVCKFTSINDMNELLCTLIPSYT